MYYTRSMYILMCIYIPEGKFGPNSSVDEFLQLRAVVDVDRLRKGVARIQRRLQRASVARHNLTEARKGARAVDFHTAPRMIKQQHRIASIRGYYTAQACYSLTKHGRTVNSQLPSIHSRVGPRIRYNSSTCIASSRARQAHVGQIYHL